MAICITGIAIQLHIHPGVLAAEAGIFKRRWILAAGIMGFAVTFSLLGIAHGTTSTYLFHVIALKLMALALVAASIPHPGYGLCLITVGVSLSLLSGYCILRGVARCIRRARFGEICGDKGHISNSGAELTLPLPCGFKMVKSDMAVSATASIIRPRCLRYRFALNGRKCSKRFFNR